MDIKKLTIIILLIIIVGIAGFGVLYYLDKNPLADDDIALVNLEEDNGDLSFKLAVYGSEDTPLNYPTGVTVKDGKIYVSDTNNHQIQVFNTKGKPLSLFGADKLKKPYGVAADGHNLYVSDVETGKIALFTLEGEFVSYLKLESKAFVKPGGLAIHDGKLFMTDLALMQIFAFNPDGTVALNFGREGNGDGEFKYPHGIAFDSLGRIYVSDAGNSRVQVFSPEGKFIKLIGAKTNEMGQIVNARGIALDKNDNLYVTSGLANKVKVYDKEGNPGKDFGTPGKDNGNLNLPTGLYIDDEQRVYVSEVGNNRVSVFAY